MGSGGADGLTDRLAFVAAEIVEHDDISGPERRHEKLLDIAAEALTVDRSVEDAGRLDPVGAQGRQKGQGAPTAMGRLADQALAARPPTAERRHVGLDPGFVNENQAAGIDAGLPGPPAFPVAGDVRPVLLAGEGGFF